VKGYSELKPETSKHEPSYLFNVKGFAVLRDVIIENIFLRTGAII
jgi:hypothetical protein